MRISDWSSDVCSSDLCAGSGENSVRKLWKTSAKAVQSVLVAGAGLSREILLELAFFTLVLIRISWLFAFGGDIRPFSRMLGVEFQPLLQPAFRIGENGLGRTFRLAHAAIDALAGINHQHVLTRSAEHTSALQSLMRISSAVFFLTT